MLTILKRKPWAIPLGIFAAMMSMFGGYALGGREVLLGEGFSMFLPAPILSTALLIFLLSPTMEKMLSNWTDEAL